MRKFVFLGNPPGIGPDGKKQTGPQPGEIGRFGRMEPGTIIPLSEHEAETITRDKDRRFELFDAKRHKGAKPHPNGRLWDDGSARLQDLSELPVEKLRQRCEAAGIPLGLNATKAEMVVALAQKDRAEAEEEDALKASAATAELARMQGGEDETATGK